MRGPEKLTFQEAMKRISIEGENEKYLVKAALTLMGKEGLTLRQAQRRVYSNAGYGEDLTSRFAGNLSAITMNEIKEIVGEQERNFVKLVQAGGKKSSRTVKG